MSPFPSDFERFNVGGHYVAYHKQGPPSPASGSETFLLMPGLGDTRHSYRFLADRLVARGHTVYACDLRGMGDSSAEFQTYTVDDATSDYEGLIASLGVDKINLVANSFTAACAVLLQGSSVGTKIKSVVLLGPFVRDPPGFGPKVFATLVPVLFAPGWGVGMWMSYWKTLFQTTPDDFAQYSSYLEKNLKEPGRRLALRKILQANRKKSDAYLAKFNLPLLLVMGTLDPDFSSPEDEANYIKDKASSKIKEVVMYENVKHYPQVEKPDQLADDVLKFLSKI